MFERKNKKKYSNLAFFTDYVDGIEPFNRTGTNNTGDNHAKWITMIPVKRLWFDNKPVNIN